MGHMGHMGLGTAGRGGDIPSFINHVKECKLTWLLSTAMPVTSPVVQLQNGSLPHVCGPQHAIPYQQQWSGRTTVALLPGVVQLPDCRGTAARYCAKAGMLMLDRPGMEGHPELLIQPGPPLAL